MSYTQEEKDILKAARLLRDYCKRNEDECEFCIFETEVGCAMYDLPDDWDILSEQEEQI